MAPKPEETEGPFLTFSHELSHGKWVIIANEDWEKIREVVKKWTEANEEIKKLGIEVTTLEVPKVPFMCPNCGIPGGCHTSSCLERGQD